MNGKIRTGILLAAASLALGFFMGGAAQAQQVPSAQPVLNQGLPDYLSKWFPKFFGKKEEGPLPEETLQAPFSDGEAARARQAEERAGILFKSADGHFYRRLSGEDGEIYIVPDYTPTGDIVAPGPLETSHRQAEHIADWLVRATSEIFTVDAQNYQKHLAHLATGMSDAGLVDFNQFMADSNIFSKLQEDGLQLRGYVEEPPLLLNEGPLAGRYRWLFEMPVTVTFLPPDVRTYRHITNPEDQSLSFIVQTQVGRVSDGPTNDSVIIETWKVRPHPRGRSSLKQ